MSKWQPIETAPKDGTIILLAETNFQNETSWDRYSNIDIGAWEEKLPGAPPDETEFWWASNYGRVENPTHWMPLPAPPQED